MLIQHCLIVTEIRTVPLLILRILVAYHQLVVGSVRYILYIMTIVIFN